jgi:hypothetical protein
VPHDDGLLAVAGRSASDADNGVFWARTENIRG